ncbi:hypothetical protein [Xanthomonas sp. SHU 308]|uniref:hypothetical protein n=1 Tax=Xanthomonas sp. SHU 308 TaxID=1591201 RepID=UPI0018E2FE90|nr:hypothetical protein [Xanthomonas sp. SHU 308]
MLYSEDDLLIETEAIRGHPVNGRATTALRFGPLELHPITLPAALEEHRRLTLEERTPNQKHLHMLKSRIFALLQTQAVEIDRLLPVC